MAGPVTVNVNVFPARTGMNRCSSTATCPISSVPRTYGDEPEELSKKYEVTLCSPHVRG